VVGADPSSDVLQDAYPAEVGYLEAADPQAPPPEYMARTIAVDPLELLACEAWPLLRKARESDDSRLVEEAKAVLRQVPKLG
jgi:hypothetical protein